MRLLRLPIFALAALSAIAPAFAQQQQTTPANFDIRVSAVLRGDLAGILIRMGQLAGCDVACHIVISHALVAIESAKPVEPVAAPSPPPPSQPEQPADKN